MKREWYIIADIKNFVNTTRVLVFNSFGGDSKQDNTKTVSHDISDLDINLLTSEDREELDSILSYDESYSIVMESAKKQKNKKTQEIKYLMDDKIFATIIENLNSRMISNILNGLVNKGILESGFDSDTNDFVFWIKNNDNKTDLEKPETD